MTTISGYPEDWSTRPHASNIYVRQVYQLQKQLQQLACLNRESDAQLRDRLPQVTHLIDELKRPMTVAQVCQLQQQLQLWGFTSQTSEQQPDHLLQQANDLIAKLDEPLTIAVVGAFNTGKSTLINAFLKQEWMPMHINRSTATVNRILAGEQPLIRLVYQDKLQRTPVEWSYGRAEDVLQLIRDAMATQSSSIAHIDVLRSGEKWLRHFTIVDTPGLNFSQEDDATTLPYLYDADVLIWVFLPENVRTRDQQILSRYRQYNPDGRILAVINGRDTLEPQDGQAVLDRVNKLLIQTGIAEQVFLISARQALMAQRNQDTALLAQSGFTAITDYLYQEVFTDYVRLHPQRIDRLSKAFIIKAAVAIGDRYCQGQGIARDESEAMQWYRLAAEQGHADAQNRLGLLYRDGKNGQPDENRMMAKIAAITPAMPQQLLKNRLVGSLLEGASAVQSVLENRIGIGQQHNHREAIKWFRLAAEQGHAQAQNNLGNLYRKGHGTQTNYQEALEWYRRSAAQGYANAQNNLGNMYRIGEGVDQNHQEALYWYRLAAAQGHINAQKNMDLILKKRQDR
ncbi:MAG: SEL1-like repeat protein [Magnetococcales bacterium]|nr:SEL1-like repeat protein [Magnetococcales bacterium]